MTGRTLASEQQARSRAAARERAQLDPTLIPHGTAAGYSYWACRCWRCRGHAAARRARQRAAAAGGAS